MKEHPMPPLPSLIEDDDRVAKLLAKPAGRIVFAAAFGVMFFESVNQFRAMVDMAAAWNRHVVTPSIERSREQARDELHKLGEVPDPEKQPGEIDAEPPAGMPAGDPSSPFAGDELVDGSDNA
jgi:hypothetical protein